MLEKIIAIDKQYADRVARDADLDFPHFPTEEFRDLVKSDADVIETLITVIKRVPEEETPEAIATEADKLHSKRFALEMAGCRVIVSPAKRTPDGGHKHSDDQRLMVTTLSTCLRLRPDFLVFVGGDGDYAPMLWELRREGIRTEVVANLINIASDLKRVAHNVIDLDDILTKISQR